MIPGINMNDERLLGLLHSDKAETFRDGKLLRYEHWREGRAGSQVVIVNEQDALAYSLLYVFLFSIEDVRFYRKRQVQSVA